MSMTGNGITGFDPNSPGPIGLSNPSTGSFTTITFSGDLNSTGIGKRFFADFSNATFSNQYSFQTNTVNGATNVSCLPNGTSLISSWSAYNAADPTNSSYAQLRISGVDVRMMSSTRGSGTALPYKVVVGPGSGLIVATTVTTTGLFQINKGRSNISKVFFDNGATTTYTYPADTSYVYLTTSAASLQITLPAASSAIDGLEIIFIPSASIATVTWVSSGATFAGAPSSLLVNAKASMIYDHATLKWYPN